MANRNARVFEWLVVATVIGVILTVAAKVYTRMLEDVQELNFELAAQNFKTVVSAVRAEWYVNRSGGQDDYIVDIYEQLPSAPVRIEGRTDPLRVYLNREGWPVNSDSVGTAQDGTLHDWECLELWNGFLAQAPLAELAGRDETAKARFKVTVADTDSGSHCRYRHMVDGFSCQYFDYFPASGKVQVGSSAE